jgi:SHS2 domain-containing protein
VYKWVEHTAELELHVEADSEEEVFAEGFQAMCELLAAEPKGPAPPREVSLSARDRPALFADWLAELAFLAESERLVPQRLASLRLEGATLRALVEGSRGEPPPLVKAATYHRLTLEPADGGYRATVVLDV